MDVTIENGEIVVRVPIEALPVALEYQDWNMNEDGTANRWRVTDTAALAKELVNALKMESETGNTFLTKAFDDAMLHVLEQGGEGIDEVQPSATTAKASVSSARSSQARTSKEPMR